MNNQPIEKLVKSDGETLDVYEIFGPTIQGEGPFAGTPCVFVRLAGCNLQCNGCDTLYSDSSVRKTMYIAIIENEIRLKFKSTGLPKGLVVISGGEPFRQNLGPLLHNLVNSGYYVQIETNGTMNASFYQVDRRDVPYNRNVQDRYGVYVVCSPKTGKVHESIEILACCMKYVLDHNSVDPTDGLPIRVLGHTVKERVWRPPANFKRPIYLQPMDHTESMRELQISSNVLFPASHSDGLVEDMNKASLKAAMDSCLKHGYILNLQIHKIIGVE